MAGGGGGGLWLWRGQFWSAVVDFRPTSVSEPSLADFGRFRANFGKIRAEFVASRPILVEIGRWRPQIGEN